MNEENHLELRRQPLECSNMVIGAFVEDVLALRKRQSPSSTSQAGGARAGELVKVEVNMDHLRQYLEIRREDLPVLMDALRQTFGELP